MKKVIVSLMLCLAATQSVHANEKIENLDAFEGKYLECIKEGLVDKCFSKILAGHFNVFFEGSEKYLTNAERSLTTWIGGRPVYAVHPASIVRLGEVFENRAYLIERDDGQLIGLLVGFRKMHGDWYVYDLQGGVEDTFIRRLLKMPRPDLTEKY